MASEPTLRAHPKLLHSLGITLTRTLCNVLGAFANSMHHLGFIFELRKLAGDDAKDSLLVRREMHKWSEGAGAFCVVLEEKCGDVELVEENLGNAVIATFAEMAGVDEISFAA